MLRSVVDPSVTLGIYFLACAYFRTDVGTHGLILLLLTLSVTYPGRLRFRRYNAMLVARVMGQWVAVLLALLALGVGTGTLAYFDPRVLIAWAVGAPAAIVLLHALAPSLAPFLRALHVERTVAIVGATEVGRRLAELITAGEAEGQRVVGFFDDRLGDRLPDGAEIVGRIDAVADYVKLHGVSVIYIALPMASQPRILALLDALRDTTASIHFVPDIFVADLIQARLTTVGGLPIVAVCESPFRGVGAGIKRVLDLAFVVPALSIGLPLMGVIALLIRATSPGSAIFKQRRYGLDGREIMVWKFRSMHVQEDGDKVYQQVTRGDDRVTPVGRILRKTSLDELPQLLNVLSGSMSLVGPRPHAVAVNEQYRRVIPGYMVRHKVKPGITGWAQVNGHRGGDDLNSMQKRIEHDLQYLRAWSPGLDVRIMLRTAVMLLAGDSKAF